MTDENKREVRERYRRDANLPTTSSELMQFALLKYLENLDFPAGKKSLLAQAQHWSAPQEVFNLLNRISEREYRNAAEVTGNLGMMQQ